MLETTVHIFHDTRYMNSEEKAQIKIRASFPFVKPNGKIGYKMHYYGTNVWLTVKEHETKSTRDERIQKSKAAIYSFFTKASNIVKDNPQIDRKLFETHMMGSYELESVSGLFEYKIKKLKELALLTKKPNSAAVYENTKNLLYKYNPNLTLFHINVEWLKAFELHGVSKGWSYSYIGMIMGHIRHIFNIAIGLKKISPDFFPFGQLENQYAIPSEDKEKIYLENREQLGLLLDYESTDEKKQRAADFLKLVFYLFGLNMADICQLRWSNIVDDTVEMYRQKTFGANKTKRKLSIPINSEAATIIKRWGVRSLNPNDFVFPILKHGMSAEQIKNTTKAFKREKVNKYAKEIGKDLGITVELNALTMRHTFSDYCFNELKQSLAQVGEMLGHAKPETTAHYFHGFRKREAMDVSQKLGNIKKVG